MFDQISIRLSTEEDIEGLLDTLIDAFEDDKALYGEPPYGSNPENEIRDQHSKKQCYTIRIDSVIAGGMYVAKIGECSYRLKRVWINKINQNKGIGSKILKLLENSLEKLKVLSLDTPYKSYRNQHFYEKNGFKKVGEIKVKAQNMQNLDPNFTLYEYRKTYDN